jgi:hypothetical protein
MPLQRALNAVETPTDADDPGDSVTERHTAFGYWWRYAYAGGGPDTNLVGAIRIAALVAEQEARKDGKTYLVATSSERWPDVYVFPHDHPDARRPTSPRCTPSRPLGNAYGAARPAISRA